MQKGKEDRAFRCKAVGLLIYEEYQKFIASYVKGSRSYPMFQLLFCTGMREGEMFALSMEDIDLENCQIHITKTYYHMNRTVIITEPKTDNSVTIIEIPIFLANKIRFYWKLLYQYLQNERLFPVAAEAVQHTMKRHIDKAEVKKIDGHSLSHLHIEHT